jgi:hypothetical protein
MQSRKDPKACDQLTFFHPLPLTPQWRDLPPEVREETRNLLARLLRTHRRAQLAVKEACDE